MSTVPVVASSATDVVAPTAILVAAVVVIVVTLVASRRAQRDPEDALRASSQVGRWRVEHGPAVDAWLAAYEDCFAGLADGLAGRAPVVVPDPVDRLLEIDLQRAAEDSPDAELASLLVEMQAAAQAALVATVAWRIPAAAAAHDDYVEVRRRALARLGSLTDDPAVADAPPRPAAP